MGTTTIVQLVVALMVEGFRGPLRGALSPLKSDLLSTPLRNSPLRLVGGVPLVGIRLLVGIWPPQSSIGIMVCVSAKDIVSCYCGGRCEDTPITSRGFSRLMGILLMGLMQSGRNFTTGGSS